MATTKFSTIIGSAQVVPVIGVLERVTSYTIGGSTTAPTPGAGATFLRVTEQYGPMAKVRFEYKQTSAGSSGSGIYQFPLSTLITVDTTRLGNGVTSTANNICGHGAIQIGANGFEAYAYYNPTLNIISLQYDPQGVASTSYLTVDNTNGSLGNATLLVSFDVWLPITNSPSVAQGAGLATSVKPGLINYYDEGTFTANFNTGMNTNTNNFTVTYTRIGRLVHLAFPDMRVTANATSPLWACATGTLPASVRPTLVKDVSVVVKNNNTVESGALIINPNGTMTFYRNTEANWTSGVTSSGPENSAVTFTI